MWEGVVECGRVIRGKATQPDREKPGEGCKHPLEGLVSRLEVRVRLSQSKLFIDHPVVVQPPVFCMQKG